MLIKFSNHIESVCVLALLATDFLFYSSNYTSKDMIFPELFCFQALHTSKKYLSGWDAKWFVRVKYITVLIKKKESKSDHDLTYVPDS